MRSIQRKEYEEEYYFRPPLYNNNYVLILLMATFLSANFLIYSAAFYILNLSKEKIIENNILKEDFEVRAGQVETIIREVDPSRFYTITIDFIIPAVFIVALCAVIVLSIILAYGKYRDIYKSNSGVSYSIFSSAFSLIGVMYAIIRSRDGILDQQAADYIFFSCFCCLIFFISLLLFKNKWASALIYLFLIFVLFLIGYLTEGSVASVALEYREMLNDVSNAYKVFLVLGTFAPFFMVFASMFYFQK